VFKAFGLTDHENVLEVDRLGVRRGRGHLWLLRFQVAAEEGQGKKDDDSGKTHAGSLGAREKRRFRSPRSLLGIARGRNSPTLEEGRILTGRGVMN
jgi:hypothetical protein